MEGDACEACGGEEVVECEGGFGGVDGCEGFVGVGVCGVFPGLDGVVWLLEGEVDGAEVAPGFGVVGCVVGEASVGVAGGGEVLEAYEGFAEEEACGVE